MNPTDTTSPTPRSFVQRLARLGRFVLFLCTAGWAFPHVCTEDMDLTAIQNEQTRDNKS